MPMSFCIGGVRVGMYNALCMKRGFTLIELLIVVAILGLLAVVVFVNLNPGGNLIDTRDSKRFTDIRQIVQAIKLYNLSVSLYPRSTPPPGPSGWATSCDSPSGWNPTAPFLANLVPAYMGVIPVDPTNSGTTCYRYRGDASNFKFAVYVEDTDSRTKYAATDGGTKADWYEIFTPGGQGYTW